LSVWPLEQVTDSRKTQKVIDALAKDVFRVSPTQVCCEHIRHASAATWGLSATDTVTCAYYTTVTAEPFKV